MTPHSTTPPPAHPGATLLVVAALIEAKAILTGTGSTATPPDPSSWNAVPILPGFDMTLTGIGKTNAAAATAAALTRTPYSTVISIGIAGALPGSGLRLTDAVLASESVYADEGLLSPAGFQTCSDLGFPLGPVAGNTIPADASLVQRFTPHVSRVGRIATVSTCSGIDALAHAVAQRTGAIAECMEGAAVAHVCARWPTPPAFAELRIISNTTGDRTKQQWDMKGALGALAALARVITR